MLPFHPTPQWLSKCWPKPEEEVHRSVKITQCEELGTSPKTEVADQYWKLCMRVWCPVLNKKSVFVWETIGNLSRLAPGNMSFAGAGGILSPVDTGYGSGDGKGAVSIDESRRLPAVELREPHENGKLKVMDLIYWKTLDKNSCIRAGRDFVSRAGKSRTDARAANQKEKGRKRRAKIIW